jgi:peroxiredoxin
MLDAESVQRLETGQPLPEFRLNDLNGQPHELADYRGRLVVINFWSAECPWAKKADSYLGPWLAEWGNAVAVLPIASNSNESLDLLKRVASQRRLPLVLWDEYNRVADAYHALTTPHIFVADREGVLCYQGAFSDMTFRTREPTRFYVKEAVDRLLAGLQPEISQVQPYGCTIVRL